MKATLIDVNPILNQLSRREGVGMNAPVMESWIARSYGRRWDVQCISNRLLHDFSASETGSFAQLTFAKSMDNLGYDLIGALPAPGEFHMPLNGGKSPTFSVLLSDDGFLVIGDPNEVNRHRRNSGN
jgi:hypothetical protein